ncbi:hypothetical protein J6590_015133 [Homalodisca vitripennis]|nr:hypothetical protein J6590_015133 [Homalodisca vitripennis]
MSDLALIFLFIAAKSKICQHFLVLVVPPEIVITPLLTQGQRDSYFKCLFYSLASRVDDEEVQSDRLFRMSKNGECEISYYFHFEEGIQVLHHPCHLRRRKAVGGSLLREGSQKPSTLKEPHPLHQSFSIVNNTYRSCYPNISTFVVDAAECQLGSPEDECDICFTLCPV